MITLDISCRSGQLHECLCFAVEPEPLNADQDKAMRRDAAVLYQAIKESHGR